MERPATFQDMMSMVQETLLLFVSFSSFFLSFFLKSVTTTCTVNTVFYSDECVKFRSFLLWNEVYCNNWSNRCFAIGCFRSGLVVIMVDDDCLICLGIK